MSKGFASQASAPISVGPLPRVLGGGDHDDGAGAPVAGAELAGKVPAVHAGHPHVEEDEGRELLLRAREGRRALRGGAHPAARVDEDHLHQREEVGVVLHDEDRARARDHGGASTTRGRLKRKVEPTPGALSNHIRPPCRRTISRLMSRPRPRPP